MKDVLELKQRRFFITKKTFVITQKGLQVNERNIFSNKEYCISFEHIGLKVLKSKSGKTGWLIASGLFFFLTISVIISKIYGADVEENAHLFYLSLTTICILIYILTYEKSFYLATNENTNAVKFLIGNPSKHKLEAFVYELKLQRKKALNTRYGQIDKLISYEQQYNQLVWLLENDALTNEEFEDKKSELKSAFKISKPISGFKFG